MGQILRGKTAADKLREKTAELAGRCRENGVSPCLLVIRLGEREDDLSYERSILKKAGAAGVEVKTAQVRYDADDPASCTEELKKTIAEANADPEVHGILLFRPLPKTLPEKEIIECIDPRKDVDGVTSASMSYVYSGYGNGFAPCTPQACMEILDAYGISPTGKRAVVIGRSLVAGRPVSMLLLRANATVTVCHTKTEDLAKTARNAQILILTVGVPQMADVTFTNEDQVIIDVGIDFLPDGTMCGDAAPSAQEACGAYTPVPGGVGAVTTSVLLLHTAQSCAGGIGIV